MPHRIYEQGSAYLASLLLTLIAGGGQGPGYDTPYLAQVLASGKDGFVPPFVGIGAFVNAESHGPISTPPEMVVRAIEAGALLDGAPATRTQNVILDGAGAGTATFTPATAGDPGKWGIEVFGLAITFAPGSTQGGATPQMVVTGYTKTGQTISMSCKANLNPGKAGTVVVLPCVPKGSNVPGAGVASPVYTPMYFRPALGAAPLDVVQSITVAVTGGIAATTFTVTLFTRGQADVDNLLQATSVAWAEGALGGRAFLHEVQAEASGTPIVDTSAIVTDPEDDDVPAGGDDDADDDEADDAGDPNPFTPSSPINFRGPGRQKKANLAVNRATIEEARAATRKLVKKARNAGNFAYAKKLIALFAETWGQAL